MSQPLADYRVATDTNRAELQTKYINAINAAALGVQKMAGECAVKFSVATTPPAQLGDLVTLLTLAQDTTNVRLATDRLLTDRSLPQRARAQGMILGMNRAITANSSYYAILGDAEKFVTQIDALPDSLNDIKIQAHSRILGQHEYLDIADGLEKHALAVIALSHDNPTSQAMAAGYSSLARSFADRLRPDSALRILDAGEKVIGPSASKSFADFRHRYELIGTRASKKVTN